METGSSGRMSFMNTSRLVFVCAIALFSSTAAWAWFGGTCAQEPAGTGGYVYHQDKDKYIPAVGRPQCKLKVGYVCEECVREREGDHPDKPWRYCVEWPDPTAPPDAPNFGNFGWCEYKSTDWIEWWYNEWGDDVWEY